MQMLYVGEWRVVAGEGMGRLTEPTEQTGATRRGEAAQEAPALCSSIRLAFISDKYILVSN